MSILSPSGVNTKGFTYTDFMGVDSSRDKSSLDTGEKQHLLALEDGFWHHVKSYLPQRARRKSTVNLWHKISTREDSKWTKKYHDSNPKNKSFGGKVIIKF